VTTVRLVAGRTEPKRQTIFGRAYRTFHARASAAWQTGHRLYSSWLAPLWRRFTLYCQEVWGWISKLISLVGATVWKWRGGSSVIVAWTVKGAGGTSEWLRNERDDLVAQGSAKSKGIKYDPKSRKEQGCRTGCLWLVVGFILLAMVGSSVCAAVLWFRPVSHLIGSLSASKGAVTVWTVVVSLIAGYILFRILLGLMRRYVFTLLHALIILSVPVTVLLALVGFVALAGVFSFYLVALAGILLITVAVSLGGATLLLAGLAGLFVVVAFLLAAMAIGLIGFGLYLFGLVLLQCVVLLVVALMRPAQYLWVIWRGIHFTCPSGRHGTFTMPAHVCPDCGSGYSRLWPSTYGVLYHQCEGKKDGHSCGQRLPTLDRLGRNRLNRVCAICGVPFVSRSSGKLPVSVIGIVGGTGVGKTSMMLMAVANLMTGSQDGSAEINAEIDTPDQRFIFEREWEKLKVGQTAEPTQGSVPDAFILRLNHGQHKSLLYIYDAPGEQFEHIDLFTPHQYLERANGLMLLVDPRSLPGFGDYAGRVAPVAGRSRTQFENVVNSCISAAERMVAHGSDGRLAMPLAVIVTMADIEAVARRVGDVTAGPSDSDACRRALIEWRGGPSVTTLESHFSKVCYFACSALGRTPNETNTAPFKSYRVLDPLTWILYGVDGG